MKDRKFIELKGKGFEKSRIIERYFHLLNLIAPNKYELNNIHIGAAIWNVKEQTCVVQFYSNIL